MRKIVIVLIGIGALGVVLYFSGFIEGFIFAYEGHAGLPSCESAHGQSDAKRAFENSPVAKTYSIASIGFTDAKTISVSDQKVECTAIVILNSAKKGVMNYIFTKDASLGGWKVLRSSIHGRR